MPCRWRVGLALAVVLAAAALSAAPAWAAYTWEGTWSSTFGEIKMTASGSGTYPNCGKLSGGVSGRTNAGDWQECSSNGEYAFHLSESGRSFDGSYTRGESNSCVFPPCDWDGTCIKGACLQNSAADPDPVSPPGAKDVAKVTRISGGGEVTARRRDGSFRVLKVGDTVGAGVELYTDIDVEATLQFPDGAVMTIKEMTQVLISDLLNEGTRQTIRVAVRLGELDATVNPQKTFQSDFKVCTPHIKGSGGNATCASVRGTRFSVFYDPVARVALISTRRGTVSVDPAASGLPTKLVPAGKEVEVTPKAISKLARLGKAGARGGVNRVKARDLVLTRLDRAAPACDLTIPRSRSVFAVKPIARGWLVSVTVRGEAKGTSKWRVRRGKARPKNRIARRIARGCP